MIKIMIFVWKIGLDELSDCDSLKVGEEIGLVKGVQFAIEAFLEFCLFLLFFGRLAVLLHGLISR